MTEHRGWSEIRREPRSPEQSAARKQAMLDATAIADLVEARKGIGITQAEVARALGVSKARVSAMERQRDVYLSTLAQYVAAIGGQLEVVAVFGDQRVPLGV